MLKHLLALTMVILINVCLVASTNKTTTTATVPASSPSSSLTLIDVYNLSNNTLRAGFEPFYFITNQFVDYLIKPNFPHALLRDDNSSESLPNRVATRLGVKEGVGNVFSQIFKLYPSLFILVIATLTFGLLVAIAGLAVCAYRCCCRPKFNPFDEKYDSIKRKINSIVLFVLLTINLLATIILFFTNQNASIAMSKMPQVANYSASQVDGYLDNDIPEFLKTLSKEILSFREDASRLFDSSVEKSVNISLEKLNITELIQLYNTNISTELKRIQELQPKLSGMVNLVNWTDVSLNEKTKDTLKTQIESIETELKSEFAFINEINSSSFKFDNIIPQLNENIKSFKQNFIQSVDTLLGDINSEISQTTLISQAKELRANMYNNDTVDALNTVTSGYKIIYFSLLGISIFMLGLFLLFALGLIGMCARRIHNNYKQVCHRGISANLFLSGVGIYFLSAILIILAVIFLYVPGITLRHVVCKPAIELENNELFLDLKESYGKNTPFSDLNLNKLIADCDKFNKSKELNAIIADKIEFFVKLNKPSILKELNKRISNIDSSSVKDSLNNFKSVLTRLSDSLKKITTTKGNEMLKILKSLKEILSKIPDQLVEKDLIKQIENELDTMNDFLTLIIDDKNQENLRNLINRLNTIIQNMDSEKDLINQTINEFVVVRFDQLAREKSIRVGNSSPSCRVLSNIYSTVVLSGCYEFLDNFNTYWFTLLVLFIIYIVVIGFSLSQADLFRKYYAFDEIAAEEVTTEDKDKESYGFRSESNSNQELRSRFQNNWPIDAYEMNKYNSEGLRYPAGTRSPQSNFRMTRA